MCSRSLTDVFVLMRNNAVQSRHMYSEQTVSDHVSLLRDESASLRLRGVDIEGGYEDHRFSHNNHSSGSHMPPPWADSLEEAQYVITRLKTKLSELDALHSKHLQRPTLDDSCMEEQLAGKLTSEISRHFATAHRIVQVIKSQCREGTPLERRLTYNVLSSLVAALQELSFAFRSSQNSYLKSLTSREERSNAFFEVPNFDEIDISGDASTSDTTQALIDYSKPSQSKNNKNSSIFFEEEDQTIDEMFQKPSGSRMNRQQMLQYEQDNTELALHREQEVNKIVKSIVDLNDIFKDLSHMVQEQGTVLDRIDYNVEQSNISVFEGFKQLQKADAYHRKNRKMHCIFILCIAIIVFFILLVTVK